MDGAPEGQEPPNLRFLRRLVTLLTVVMIAGLLTIVALFVIRLGAPGPTPLPLPDALELPEGAQPLSFTQGPGWAAVVTRGGQILIFNPDGTLAQRIEVTLP